MGIYVKKIQLRNQYFVIFQIIISSMDFNPRFFTALHIVSIEAESLTVLLL